MSVLFSGGTVWAGEKPAPEPGWVLVSDGRIRAVGRDGDELPTADEVVDCTGRHVLPGFVDSHTHLSGSALFGRMADGLTWIGERAVLDGVRDFAATAPEDGWVVAVNVEHDFLVSVGPHFAEALDEASGGRPVLLADSSLHRGTLSTAAAKRMRFTGAHLRRDVVTKGGKPTGLVYEEPFGQAWFTALRDLTTRCDPVDAIVAEARRHLAYGITTTHEPGVPADVAAHLVEARGRTPLRMSWSATAGSGLLAAPDAAERDAVAESGGSGVKLFLDGAHRCAVCVPVTVAARAFRYAVGQAWKGRTLDPLRLMAGAEMRVSRGRLQAPYLRLTDEELGSPIYRSTPLRVHAIGNLAVSQAVRVLGGRSKVVLEHVVALRPRELADLAATGFGVSAQPGFLGSRGDGLAARGLLPDLMVMPLRSMIAAGMTVAISSDNPCAGLDPLENLRLAVTRRSEDGTVITPEETLSPAQAVHAATVAGSVLLDRVGPHGITEGARADIAVCDGDPLLPSTTVAQTWVDGRCAWSSDESSTDE